MGKVKDMSADQKSQKKGFVSIPYGKGKVTVALLFALSLLVYQSPMGKVKLVLRFIFLHFLFLTYQSPMGKVKVGRRAPEDEGQSVSIPYGKGKENAKSKRRSTRNKVSIPYGKGKEQHFVLHFQYTP